MLFCGLQLFETMTNFKNISILLASLLLINCAKRTTISGGDKDTIAPKIINSLPKNFSTNFEGNEIKITFDELIKDIKDGVYITDLVGLHAGVKAVSGEFSLQASGQKIVDGKLDHAVKMIVVSGNFFDMMNHIKGIANDLKFELSGIGSPSIYVESLMIGGE